MASAADPRDLLPLPVPAADGALEDGLCSQKWQRSWYAEGVKALNAMGGRGCSVQASRSSACQRSSLAGLEAVYGALAPCPVDVTPRRALLHTLGSEAGYGDSDTLVTQGAHTVHQRGEKVALPSTRGGDLKLATVAPECVQQLLVEHDASPLLSSCPSQFYGRLAFLIPGWREIPSPSATPSGPIGVLVSFVLLAVESHGAMWRRSSS